MKQKSKVSKAFRESFVLRDLVWIINGLEVVFEGYGGGGYVLSFASKCPNTYSIMTLASSLLET